MLEILPEKPLKLANACEATSTRDQRVLTPTASTKYDMGTGYVRDRKGYDEVLPSSSSHTSSPPTRQHTKRHTHLKPRSRGPRFYKQDETRSPPRRGARYDQDRPYLGRKSPERNFTFNNNRIFSGRNEFDAQPNLDYHLPAMRGSNTYCADPMDDFFTYNEEQRSIDNHYRRHTTLRGRPQQFSQPTDPHEEARARYRSRHPNRACSPNYFQTMKPTKLQLPVDQYQEDAMQLRADSRSPMTPRRKVSSSKYSDFLDDICTTAFTRTSPAIDDEEISRFYDSKTMGKQHVPDDDQYCDDKRIAKYRSGREDSSDFATPPRHQQRGNDRTDHKPPPPTTTPPLPHRPRTKRITPVKYPEVSELDRSARMNGGDADLENMYGGMLPGRRETRERTAEVMLVPDTRNSRDDQVDPRDSTNRSQRRYGDEKSDKKLELRDARSDHSRELSDSDDHRESPRSPTDHKPNIKRKLCRHFLKGFCKQGDKCCFLHDPSIFCADSQKVFLGGLPTKITSEELVEEMGKLGFKVLNKPNILRGFSPQVCMEDSKTAEKLVEKTKICIQGSMVDVRKYVDKHPDCEARRSIFLGGLPAGTTGNDIRVSLLKQNYIVVNNPIIKSGFAPQVILDLSAQAQQLVAAKRISVNNHMVDVRPYVNFRKRYA